MSEHVPEWSPPLDFRDLKYEGDLIADLIAAFREDVSRRLGLLREALADNDIKGIRAQTHAIKGSAEQMKADSVTAACEEIERAIRDQQKPDLEPLVQQLAATAEAIFTAMDRYRRLKSPSVE